MESFIPSFFRWSRSSGSGWLLILLIPRRVAISNFRALISFWHFVASLHLPVHLHRAWGLSNSKSISLDRHAEHSLPHGHRRHLRLAGMLTTFLTPCAC